MVSDTHSSNFMLSEAFRKTMRRATAAVFRRDTTGCIDDLLMRGTAEQWLGCLVACYTGR
jgi:hypothetical protein